MLLNTSSKKQEPDDLPQKLTNNIEEATQLDFDNVCYFASWNRGIEHHVEIVAYNNTNLFSSEEEQFTKYRKIDYLVSKTDFHELQTVAENFEAIIPFSTKVLQKLISITEKYEPVNVSIAKFTETGEEIINKIT